MTTMAELRPIESVSADFTVSYNDISGSGGMMGGSSKGGGSTKSDANNTLRSNAKAKLVEVIGEGEIVGLVNGARSIFFDATPLQNADGSYNFKGVTWQQRTGLPDQPMLTGVAQSETPYQVGVEVKNAQEPPVRTIADRNATSVRIIINIPSLVIQDPNSGSLKPTDLDYVIERRPAGGQWVAVRRELFLQQKTTSPYQKATTIDLPEEGYPWSIRARKINTDAGVEWHQNSMIWESYTVITEGRFVYPNTALVAMDLDASNFGSSIPARYYDIKGLIIQVPSNYDPEARTYGGFWDGTFKRAWTNNPAWIFYDLLTNNRYGLGEFIDASKIDKFGLYEIAQWCDALVDDGFGGKEPRYTFNGVINSREEAFKVLQQITTSFRGQAFWSVGQVFAIADMPADVQRIVAPANVIGGSFKYSRTAKKTRNTVAMVSWNDPEDFYRNAIEVVQHDEGLDKFGWRQTDIQAVGCTSRGLANRIGRWTLDTEHTATESVEFEMGLEALAKDPLKPGHIIAVADPRKAQTRIGGRIKSIAGNRVTLDKPFEALAGSTYRLSLTLASGGLQTVGIAGFDGAVAIISEPLSEQPVPGAMWAITGSDVAPRQYRILSVTEPKKNSFKISALTHDPQKYARVEEGIVLDPIRYTRPRSKIAPVTNIKVAERQFIRDGLPRSEVLISWSPANDWLSSSYQVLLRGPDGDVDMGVTTAPSMTVGELAIGDWTVYVTAIGVGQARSEAAEKAFSVTGWSGLSGPEIVDLQVKGGGTVFTGTDCSLEWDVKFPEGEAPYEVDFVVRVFEVGSNALLSEWISPGAEWTYPFGENVNDGGPRRKFWVQVRARGLTGTEGKPASIVVENSAPDVILPEIHTISETIFIDAPPQADKDFVGLLVWMSRTSGFNPLAMEPTATAIGTRVQLAAEVEQTYYVRIAGYDQFGKTGLNISGEFPVKVTNKLFDPFAPSIPTGLKLTTSAEIAPDGTVTGVVKATWNPVTTENFGRYDVAASEDDGSFINFGASEASWEYHGFRPGTKVTVKLRSISKGVGVPSDWGAPVSIVAALNTTPPDNPKDVVAEASFQTAFVSWTAPAAKDLAFVEVWASSDKTNRLAGIGAGPVMNKAPAGSTTYTDPALSIDGKRYYWLRSVNSSGVPATAFLGPYEAVSARIIKDQIAQAAIDATKFVSGIEPVGIWENSVLPSPTTWTGPKTLFWAVDGKLYRLDTTKTPKVWTATVRSADIEGTVKAAQIESLNAEKLTSTIKTVQIADDAISAPKILAGAVVAGKLAANAVTAGTIAAQAVTAGALAAGSVSTDSLQANAVTAGKIQAGAVSTNQLAANAVTTDKLLAGAVSADKIAANAVIADKIQAGAVYGDKIAANGVTAREIAANSINAGHIQADAINARMITLGSSTAKLSNWLNGADNTKIDGGSLATNSVVTNALKVGSRTFRTIGISFESTRDGQGNLTGNMTWTGGSVIWQNDDGNAQAAGVSSGSVYHGGANVYVWWNKTIPTIFQGGNENSWSAILNDPNNVLVAQCSGSTGVVVYNGGTVIDGTRIVARSIVADRIAANAIQAQHISAGAITADKIYSGQISVNQTIQIGNRLFLEALSNGSAGRIRCVNNDNTQNRIVIGELSGFTGPQDYGILCYANDGTLVFRCSTNGTYMEGAYIKSGTIGSVQIGQGSITSANIGLLQVDSARIANLTVGNEKITNGAVTQAGLGGSWAGSTTPWQVINVRSNEARVLIIGTISNNPNTARAQINPGVAFIKWAVNNDGGNVRDVASVYKNFYVENGGFYWGSTTLQAVVQPGAGFHAFRMDTNQGGDDNTSIVVIELSK